VSVAPARALRAELVTALAFLTRLPVAAGMDMTRTGAGTYGVAGALVGALAALPLLAIGARAPLVGAALSVAVVAAVTGAIHLDGLADTADALAAPDAEAAERARRDPRIGAAGAAAVTLTIVIEVALLAALVERAGALVAALGCIVAAATSRAAAPMAARASRLPWARALQGTPAPSTHGRLGAWFIRSVSSGEATAALLSAAAIAASAALVAPAALAGFAIGSVAALAVAGWLLRVRGGLDGDGFGFIVEGTFAATLLGVLVWL
jgi:adenosylcobinamide-GDP ribazoletransferase